MDEIGSIFDRLELAANELPADGVIEREGGEISVYRRLLELHDLTARLSEILRTNPSDGAAIMRALAEVASGKAIQALADFIETFDRPEGPGGEVIGHTVGYVSRMVEMYRQYDDPRATGLAH